MIPRLLVLCVLAVPAFASAKVVNVELKFTPYVGDAAKADTVDSVSGSAAIFVNGVPYADQLVRKDSVPVQSEGREIAAAVWLPIESLGPVVRKGKNTIRIEFTPDDPGTAYRARLSWVSVTDEEAPGGKDGKPTGKLTATNMTAPGKDEKAATGKIVMAHTISADFAPDVPWHHYPSVTTLSDDDKQKLAALVLARVGVFKPDFADMYRLLEGDQRLDVAKIKEAKCVEAAYAAGVRLDAPTAEQLEYVVTNNPEVVVRRKGRHLYAPADASAFGKIEGEEKQMCAGIALSLAFPPRLTAVRDPDGKWRVVY
jgi:hypothetical protein